MEREGDLCLKSPDFGASAALRGQVGSSVATWMLGPCSASTLQVVIAPVTDLKTLKSEYEQFKNKMFKRHSMNLLGFTVQNMKEVFNFSPVLVST